MCVVKWLLLTATGDRALRHSKGVFLCSYFAELKARRQLEPRRSEGNTVRFKTMGIEEEADRTLFVRNLDSRVTEELLFELFVQVTLFC